jgi:hypothetical protein
MAVGIILAIIEFLTTGKIDVGKHPDEMSENELEDIANIGLYGPSSGMLLNIMDDLFALNASDTYADDLNKINSPKDSNTNIKVHDASIEWIDIECKNNKKLYDTKGNILVIGNPSSKIHTMATYDINGTLIEDSSVKVKKVAKKVIFMDSNDKKDEKGKLKKLYEEGYISKSKYNSLMRDLNK